MVRTLAGSGTSDLVDGVGTMASIILPRAICVDTSLTVYLGDVNLRMITTAGIAIIRLLFLFLH